MEILSCKLISIFECDVELFGEFVLSVVDNFEEERAEEGGWDNC